MKASIAHGVRPSVLILGKDSKKGWSRWDTLLAKAYQRYLNELCQQCGYPKYMCHTSDNRIGFSPKLDECAATAVAERKQEELTKMKSPPKGVKVFAQAKLTPDAIAEGMEFSDFRRPYQIEQAKALGLIPNE